MLLKLTLARTPDPNRPTYGSKGVMTYEVVDEFCPGGASVTIHCGLNLAFHAYCYVTVRSQIENAYFKHEA